jgi:hypothetical protein
VVDELVLFGEHGGGEVPRVHAALQDQECSMTCWVEHHDSVLTGPWESVTAISSRRTWEVHSWWLSWS